MTTEKDKKYDNLYMDIACRVAQQSYATRKKVGAILVKDGNILSMGWNGMPAGYPNPCEDENNVTLSQVQHAEINLFGKLARHGGNANGATLYLTLSPCHVCAGLILAAGIKRVVWGEVYRNTDGIDMLKHSNIDFDFYEGDKDV